MAGWGGAYNNKWNKWLGFIVRSREYGWVVKGVCKAELVGVYSKMRSVCLGGKGLF